MNNKILKILSLGLAAITAFSISTPVFAYELNDNGNSVESIEYQNDKDEIFSNVTNVFAELASKYEVTIPKIIVLSGASKSAKYTVKVEGDIAGYEKVNVVPDDSFKLFTKNKDSRTATINQDKTSWTVHEFGTDANGTIIAPDITAGKWQGFFNFNISFTKVLGDIVLPGTDDPAFDSTIKTEPTAKQLTYSGSAQALVNAGSATNGTMQYSTDNKTWSTAIPTGIDAGVYTVYYRVIGNTNYKDIVSKSITVTIKKKNNTITTNTTRLTINDTNDKTIAITNPSNGTLSITNSDNSIATASLNETNITVKPLKEGVATITIKSATTSNYNENSKTIIVDVGHNYVNGKCTRCGQVDINKLSGGMYDTNYNLIKSWDALVNEGTITVNNGAMHIGSIISSADSGTNLPENTKNAKINGIIVVPETITKLDANAFYALHNLTGVVLPSSLKSIGINAFYGVKNMHLNDILIKDGNTNFKTVNGILYNADMTTLIKYPVTKKATSFTVPNSVKIIDSSAFAGNTYIRNVTLPTGVTNIGISAFDMSGLQTINLPNTLKTIGAYAFCGCSNITSITLPDSLTRIDTAAFAATNITKVFIPKSVTTINVGLDVWGGYDAIFAHTPMKTIYCEAPSKPSGWSNYWDVKTPSTNARCNVIWNATRNQTQ